MEIEPINTDGSQAEGIAGFARRHGATNGNASLQAQAGRERIRLRAEISTGREYARMIRVTKILLELFVSLVLAVIPISAFARQSGDTLASGPAQEISHSERAATFKGTEVLAKVRVPIRRAIAIAETRVAGAKIVDIGFDEESDQVAYKVRTYKHNEIWTGTIDASTGDIIGEGVVTPVASLEGKEKADLANFRASRMDLAEAIAIAEAYGAGSAVSAGLKEQNGKPIFVVVVVADGTLREVSVEMARSCRVDKRTPRKGTRRSSVVDGHCKATSPSAT